MKIFEMNAVLQECNDGGISHNSKNHSIINKKMRLQDKLKKCFLIILSYP